MTLSVIKQMKLRRLDTHVCNPVDVRGHLHLPLLCVYIVRAVSVIRRIQRDDSHTLCSLLHFYTLNSLNVNEGQNSHLHATWDGLFEQAVSRNILSNTLYSPFLFFGSFGFVLWRNFLEGWI